MDIERFLCWNELKICEKIHLLKKNYNEDDKSMMS